MRKYVSFVVIITILFINVLPTYAATTNENLVIEYNGETHNYTNKTVTLVVDGEKIQTGDMPAIIIDNRTLVPAREVFESGKIGATVDYNSEKQEVYIKHKDKSIVLVLGSKIAFVNGQPVELDVPAMLIRDVSKKNWKTMIPIRFVTEQLGYTMAWDNTTFTANMTSTPKKDDDNLNTDGQLTQVTPTKAKRPLPTALASNPIEWKVNGTSGASQQSLKIPEVSQPTVTITSVEYVNTDSVSRFEIKATGPITGATTSMWNEKFIIDIPNALYGLDTQSGVYKKAYSDNPITTLVESSQQKKDQYQRDVLRVNFSLINKDSKLSISLSEDRTILYVELFDKRLNTITIGQNNVGDYILLKGNVSPDVNVYRLSNPERIVVDVLDMNQSLGNQVLSGISGQYITAATASKGSGIILETDGQPDYIVTKKADGSTMIQLKEPTLNNISYTNASVPVITLKNSGNLIPVDAITYEDKYLEREYIIHLPGDYRNLFGQGDMAISSDIIESVEVVNNENGYTDLIIKEKGIYEFRIEADNQNIYLKAYKPSDVYSKIVVIDAGHGGNDPGCISGTDIYEKDITLAIVKYLKAYLDQNPSIKVYYTRLADTYPTLQERCEIANQIGADIFISVHINSTDYAAPNGTETHYFLDDSKKPSSYEMAEIIQKNILSQLGLFDRGTKKSNGLYVLRNTKMPAALLEVGFISNSSDLAVITNPEMQKKCAEGIYYSIIEIFNSNVIGN